MSLKMTAKRYELTVADSALLDTVLIGLAQFNDTISAILDYEKSISEAVAECRRRYERNTRRDSSEEPIYLYGALVCRAVEFSKPKAV